MKIILPVAGKGSRLRPHTHTKPKSLVHVAGKSVLRHIMDSLVPLQPEQFIFIVDRNGPIIQEYVSKHYPDINVEFVEQKEMLGPAHAVWLAKPLIKKGDDILIVFNDTMFITDLGKIHENCGTCDGLIYSKKVEDYKRFGVIVLDKNDKITKLVEKPTEPISRLAQVGLYYMKEGLTLMNAIDYTIQHKMTVNNEYFLPNAFQHMIEKGLKLKAPEIDEWLDCGKPETLLETNRYLLEHGNQKFIKGENVTIIQPVYIEDSVVIKASIIGPNVSISHNSKIVNSIIRNSIIDNDTLIEDSFLDHSLIGSYALVKSAPKRLNVGDNSEIHYN
jgi:glucose-1-phosphate thymidylyltransferase